MELKVEDTGSDYIVTEPDGTKHHICNLFFGQMITKWEKYGLTKYYYKRNVPKHYFNKAKRLEKAGYSTYYNYDFWQKEYKECCGFPVGLSTNEAIKLLEGNNENNKL